MNYIAVNILMYWFGWVWCVILGSHGLTFAALLITAASLVLQLQHAKKFSIASYYQDLFLTFYTIIAGFLMETFFVSTNVLSYAPFTSKTHFFPPLWIVALYPLFAMTFNHSLIYINRNAKLYIPTIGAAVSFTYFLEYAMGATRFPTGSSAHYFILFVCWTLFIYLMYLFNRSLRRQLLSLFDPIELKKSITVLYDGDCPICKKEMARLQKKNQKNLVVFVDISRRGYTQEAYQNISYEDAMKVLHVIDDKGRVFRGPRAFEKLYIRLDSPFFSVLFDTPIFGIIASFIYAFFARNRLKWTGRVK